MKIATYNLQHCLGYVDQTTGKVIEKFKDRVIQFDIFDKALKELDADIVGLEEIFGEGEHEKWTAQAPRLAWGAGYNDCAFSSAINFEGNNPYGNAILSRIPITNIQRIAIPDPIEKKYSGYYETRGALKVKLENGYTVMVAHFGLNPDEQENAVKTVLEHAEKEKFILMGDFNMKPDNEILKPIFAALKDTANLVEGNGFTFPSVNSYMKIDYIFVSHDIEVISAEVPNIVASDHLPFAVEIK